MVWEIYSYLGLWSSNMFLLKQKLPVEVADINSIQINLQMHKSQVNHKFPGMFKKYTLFLASITHNFIYRISGQNVLFDKYQKF